MFNTEQSEQKWAAVLDHAEAPAFKDNYRRSVTAALLENQQKALKEERSMLAEADLGTGAIQNFDPILISLVRRAMPNLIAYDIAGVQPMSGPTGLIFALKPKFLTGTNAGQDALYGGALGGVTSAPTLTADSTVTASTFGYTTTSTGTIASGSQTLTLTATNSQVSIGDLVIGSTSVVPGTTVTAVNGTAVSLSSAVIATISSAVLTFINIAPVDTSFAAKKSTVEGEVLGGQSTPFSEMGFDIEKTVVTAQTRALKASYTMELAQDLKAVHGLDAESELANILSSEILFEINREIIGLVNSQAVTGCRWNTTNSTPGVYNVATDADGRWAAERYKSLHMAIELEANQIAKETRRGKGNFILCSSNVASALAASGSLDYAPALSTKLEVDDTGNTFAGVLNGRIKVYIDPYAFTDYITVGYRGTNPYDAGLFYAPYVPLTMVRAIDPATFQPRIAFKTRYGVTANPFVQQISAVGGQYDSTYAGKNFYYRKFDVRNISLKGAAV
jgi:hypothetical protein